MHINRYREKTVDELKGLVAALEKMCEVTTMENKITLLGEIGMLEKLIKEKENEINNT